MNKVLYIILLSLFSLTIISCAKKDDSLSSSSGSTESTEVVRVIGSSSTLKISPFVITLTSGTIKGSALSQSSNSALSDVNVSYTQSGTTIVDTATDSSGDFSKSLAIGTYTLTYSKSGYLDEIQSATLSGDNQTLVVSTLMMLPDSCTSGTISGTIKNASNRALIEGVSLSARRGLNVTTGTIAKTDTTSNSGTYSFSGMSPGWYTVETVSYTHLTLPTKA